MERSCLQCHQRKVRCSKTLPCAACSRLGVSCRYPSADRPRRVQKATITDRVAQLERSLAVLANSPSSSSPSDPKRDTSYLPDLPPSPSRRQELLVPDGISTRYINETFLSRILKKDSRLHQVISTRDHANATNSVRDFRPEGLLARSRLHGSSESATLDLSSWQATQLWQIYRANVDPVAKILHLPTVEPLVYCTMNEGGTDDSRALLFAIYFAAVTSLSATDAANLLGRDKRSALLDFQGRIETALVDAACFDLPSILSLQALAIYITCLRAHSTSRSGWIINGVLIRSALSIGLHRDGSHFNLSPLEAELRRRLWWQILVLDYRAAEDHGIAVHGLGSRADTHLPVHVDDCDLGADIRVLPSTRAKWTEMTGFLLIAEISIAFQRLAAQPIETAQSLQTVQDLNVYVEQTYLRHCNVHIPIQKAYWLASRSLLAKFEFFVHQQVLHADQPQECVSSTAEQTLVAACTCLELSAQLVTDDLLRGFRWLFASYNQFHCLTYLVWQLCAQPSGPQVARAWSIVDCVFDLTENDPGRPDPGPIWNVLRYLREKARHRREGLASESETAKRVEGEVEEEGLELVPNLDASLSEWVDFSENLGLFRFDL
ncbi:hypothetical protein EYZ11_005195 [Aspergillus tanneri]|uniref:Zn(2)-C6 fungal-type domain-containing protein n=1 Tax=Aspergillus tanneri TaxID=1220188 RepID=A0A4S3JJ85_9EURO|nr:uncharacterized protein ATNIH1004_000101 [Aspergillus tanneri]KAA8651223.1 hypothetical protein ATNIH1004_000101 [Aspergillus tanneri]THC95335.1 hypothetical protein EYZ11_005195 [Aspergillus tanneri]